MQATAELFDEEGFLKTGDVVEQRDHETFIWLDRVKNIIKLAQVGAPTEFFNVSGPVLIERQHSLSVPSNKP